MMRAVSALWLRFYRYVGGVLGLMFIGVAGGGGIYLIQRGFLGPLPGVMFAMVVGAIMASIVGATKYQRSAATPDQEEMLAPLLRSREEYCLVLRPFGHDGAVIVPRARRDGRAGGRVFVPNTTIEQVVADAVRTVLGFHTYAIVDQGIAFAPPGLTFVRAAHDDWKRVAQSLIRRAHSIVLILAPGDDIRTGFAWEIEQIVRYHRQPRTIIVTARDNWDPAGRSPGVARADALLAMLAETAREAIEGPVPRHGDWTDDTLVVRCAPPLGERRWRVASDEPQRSRVLRRRPRRVVVTDDTYRGVLIAALNETEVELRDQDFEARYRRVSRP